MSSTSSSETLSEARRCQDSGGQWVVDVKRNDRVMSTFSLTPDLLPPRKNAKGKVVWCLPSDPKVAPRLGLHEQKLVLALYKKQRKEKKDANRAISQMRKKDDAKREKVEKWAARTLQARWRGRLARRRAAEERQRHLAVLEEQQHTWQLPNGILDDDEDDVVVIGKGEEVNDGDEQKRAWIAQWKLQTIENLDQLAEAAWREEKNRLERLAEHQRKHYAAPYALTDVISNHQPTPPPPPGLQRTVAPPALINEISAPMASPPPGLFGF